MNSVALHLASCYITSIVSPYFKSHISIKCIKTYIILLRVYIYICIITNATISMHTAKQNSWSDNHTYV